MLANHRRNCNVEYASASTVTIGAGEVMLVNSAGDAYRMRANTAVVTLDLTADLDTGTEQTSQEYYVYAVADADATTFTGIISESDTFPTGVTYARKIGTFYNGSGDDIDADSVINSTDTPTTGFGSWSTTDRDGTTYADETSYLAASDGFVVGFAGDGNAVSNLLGYTDSSNPPTTQRWYQHQQRSDAIHYSSIMMPVRKGDYWKVTSSNTAYTIFWMPLRG